MTLPATQPGAPVRFGKYRLVERLGRGGMAEVWKALVSGPAGFQRTLVVKRILPHLVEDPHFIQMFIAEARLSARLNHGNIVQVYELGDVAGEYYLAMEYVHGRDLVDVMRAQLLRGMPDPGLAVYAVREISRALGYAHALTDDRGVPLRLIHRDVSPSNVMLGFDGMVKLLDFGIAKALSEASENQTQTGTLKGKFGYMSPEQVEGRPFDHRADLFAVGIVLHEALCGRRLFKGAGELQTIAMVRETKVEPPSRTNPAVPPELDRICLRALARRPEDRYPSCDELASDLDQVAHQLSWGPDRLKSTLRELFPDDQTQARDLDRGDEEHASGASFKLLERQRRRRRVAISTGASLLAAGLVWVIAAQLRRPPVVPAAAVKPLASERAAIPAAPIAPPAPAIAARPAVRKQVKVEVVSSPPGAEVFLAGEPKARGRTPLTLTLTRSPEPRRLTLRARGYRDDALDVTPDRDATVQLSLAPLPAAPVRRAPKRSRAQVPNLKRGDVVDPFAK